MQYMYCAQKHLMHTSEDVQSTQVQIFIQTILYVWTQRLCRYKKNQKYKLYESLPIWLVLDIIISFHQYCDLRGFTLTYTVNNLFTLTTRGSL